MITHWAVPLAGIDPSRVSLTHLHAVASGLADQQHWASPKPWAARPPRFLDGLPVLEITTLTTDSADQLRTSVAPGTAIRFGSQHGTALAAPHPLTATTWTDLHRETPTEPSWTVRFRTPATFGNGNRFSPWPDPAAVARSLTTRWNTFNPDPTQHFDEDQRLWRRIWVSDVEGHTELLPLPGLTVPGFLGRIRYHCDDPGVATTLHRLLLFAELAGLGRYTTRGLGIITLDSGAGRNPVVSGPQKSPRSVQRSDQRKQYNSDVPGSPAERAGGRSVQ